MGGASEGQDIKVEFHEPESIRSKRRREMLAIVTPKPLEGRPTATQLRKKTATTCALKGTEGPAHKDHEP